MIIQKLNSRLVATSGDNLIVCEINSGCDQTVKIPAPDLPPNLTRGQLEVLNKEDRSVVSLATSKDERFIGVATENKQVVVYDTNLAVHKNFIVNRTASKIVFTSKGDVLVADRSGDVYLFQLEDEKSEPILLLGHLSMILDMVLSDCERYIITCDRDEKIRVSHFPNTYNIARYCLGHEQFITTLKIIQNNLVSASGDGTVRVWDYKVGKQLSVINTNQYINNIKLIEEFSDKMDQEKVDVTTLPIVDMQICSDDKCVIIAVCLYSYNAVQIYNLMLDTYCWNPVTSVQALHHPFQILLSENLYVFDNRTVTSYQFTNNSCLPTKRPRIEDFYNNFKNILKINDNSFITVLYKRKYDNVQEYLKRKKLRLESSK